MCTECGKAVCSECGVEVDGRRVCRNCLAVGSVRAGSSPPQVIPTNRMALWSMVLGLGAWLVFLFNITVGSLITLATLGLALVCLIPLPLLMYGGWIAAVVAGRRATRQLAETGNRERGHGMARTGLISAYIGLGVNVFLCLIPAVLMAAGLSVPFIDQLLREIGG